MSQVFPEGRVVHPIEQESFRRLRSRLDTSHLPPLTRAVVERVIHSAADLEYADDLVTDEEALRHAHAALHAGAPVVVDVEMVAAGDHPPRHRLPPEGGRVGPGSDAFRARRAARVRTGRARRPVGDRLRAHRS